MRTSRWLIAGAITLSLSALQAQAQTCAANTRAFAHAMLLMTTGRLTGGN